MVCTLQSGEYERLAATFIQIQDYVLPHDTNVTIWHKRDCQNQTVQ